MIALKLWTLWSGLRSSWIAKWITVALVGGSVYLAHNIFIKRQAVKAFVADSKKEGRKKNAKSKNIRDKAAKPGAAARLLKSDCRDC